MRVVDAVHRKRRHGVELGVAHLANLAAGVDQFVRIGELADHAVNFVVADTQLVANLVRDLSRSFRHHRPSSCPLKNCFSYASTPFTSDIAIIGRKRAKSRNSVRNSPKVPANVHMSTQVGWK